MTPRELEQQLRSFAADRHHDPVVDPLMTRAETLEAQLHTAKQKQAEAEKADIDANLSAETALAKGQHADTTSLQRLRAAVVETAHTTQLVRNALEQVRREIARTVEARAERDVATLTPIFSQLASLYHERALAVVEVSDLLELAHRIANDVLPSASTPLQQGFGGALTRERLTIWRRRVEGAGLMPSSLPKTRRVA